MLCERRQESTIAVGGGTESGRGGGRRWESGQIAIPRKWSHLDHNGHIAGAGGGVGRG